MPAGLGPQRRRSSSMTSKSLFALIVPVLLAIGNLPAQSVTGSIVGSVKDASGLAVFGAHITLTQATTGVTRQTVTNDHGDFVFASVPPGEYNLTVMAEQFKVAERGSIMLTAS